MALITEKELKHLAELARIKLSEHEEKKLLKDVEEILEYFNQLKEVDVSNIEPMTGGTIQKNVFRNDDDPIRKEINATDEDLIEAFPEKEKRFLKVPPVFE